MQFEDDSVWRRPSEPAVAPLAPGGPLLLPAPPPAPVVEPVIAPTTLGVRHHLLVLAVALLGGLLGVGGAVVQELRAGVFAFVGAGVIEEALKPAGIYLLLVKWPHALRGRLYTAAATAISGLVFGLVEACVYVFVYFPEGGADFVAYRFTVPLAMHTSLSFLVGLGVKRDLIDWANGLAPFPKDSRNFFVVAMAAHALFNMVAFVLAVTGALDFGLDE